VSESIQIAISTKPPDGLRLRLRSSRARLWRSDFVRKVAQTYLSQVVSLALAVVSTIVIARALGPSGRGLYAAAIAVATLGVQFGNLGLNASNTYYLAQEPELLRTVLGNALLASVGVGAVAGVVTWSFFHSFPQWAIVPSNLLLFGLLWIPVGLTYLLCQSMLVALHRVTEYNLIELVNRGITLLLVGFVIVSGKIDPPRMMLAALAGQVTGAVWSYCRVSSGFEGMPKPSLRILREHMQVGSKAYLIMFFSFMVLKIDTLLVKWMLGAEQTGYYSVAASMADYVLLLPITIAMILFPKLSAIRDGVEKLRRAKYAVAGTAAGLVPLLLLAGLTAHYATKLLFGAAFLPAADAFIWLLPGIFTLGVEIVLVQFLNSIGYPPIVIWSWFVSCVTNIALNIYIIPRRGIIGASAVSSVTYSLTLAFIFAIVKFRWYTPVEAAKA
jgi:O-antigen/teichoic acid export membrane protein